MKEKIETSENSWEATQSSLAEKSGLAIVLVDENSSALSRVNNNSVCSVLYASEEFAPECEKYCGRAFQMAAEKGKTAAYQCYAGLDCRAVPVKDGGETRLVAITGRVFTSAENYRRASERAASGDWAKFSPDDFFENVLLDGSASNLEAAAADLENLNADEKTALFEFTGKTFGDETAVDETKKTETAKEEIAKAETAQEEEIELEFYPQAKSKIPSQADEAARLVKEFQTATAQAAIVPNKFTRKSAEEAEEVAEWRSLFGSLLSLTYKKACFSILQFLSRRYSLESVAWLERRDSRFEIVLGTGKLKNHKMEFGIPADHARLLDAARRELSIEMRERNDGAEIVSAASTIRLFPVAVGGEIKAGLILGDEVADKNIQRHIARFCQTVASELEILRLREELSRRGWLERAIQRFNDNLHKIDSEDFWLGLTQISAELMKAERSSLMIFDEKTDSLTVKAAIGLNADKIRNEKKTLGNRVAAEVLNNGKPLVVQDVEKTEMERAPLDWKYKSKSFISYPIKIGGRKIGVLNLTDKTDGETYNELDLDLLDKIVPQLAVLIDRAALKQQAGEFEQLSVTDALTGLLNRRYLEERLTEEIRRSDRPGFQMSIIMIDVDDFKSYNDSFSHPEGDKALKIVAQCLRETLRGADVAARVGGEEFSILLPQTTSADAQIIAERIRERVDAADFPNRNVTVSVGVASCSQHIYTAEDIIQAADDALYEAKRRGRNNVQIYENLNIAGYGAKTQRSKIKK
ncbi:MAG: diguanylate cyclase [Acidobacteriota bacterium]|nr:diguanylate cyclase [Acidobacteriota bacterium]